MSEVNSNVDLFGADNVMDLLILRGSGEVVDWSKESEVSISDSPFLQWISFRDVGSAVVLFARSISMI